MQFNLCKVHYKYKTMLTGSVSHSNNFTGCNCIQNDYTLQFQASCSNCLREHLLAEKDSERKYFSPLSSSYVLPESWELFIHSIVQVQPKIHTPHTERNDEERERQVGGAGGKDS